MQTTPQTPPPLTPGAILASPQGRGAITIVTVQPSLQALMGDGLYTWRLESALKTLTRMEFTVVGHEDPDVLDERVALAERTYQLRAFGRAA